MAKTMRLLQTVVLTVFILSGFLAGRAEAQNVFHVWFDTVTAKAGDTVSVNVYYTFTSTHGHNLDYFRVRLKYDSTEVFPIGYDLAGTASAMLFDTTPSHLGITALGQSEIDLTNPVLLRIRFRVNRQLADTAFVRWDTAFSVFDESDSVDQVIRKDGWIRTATAAGHVVLNTPPVTIHGVTAGYSPDSIGFVLPIIVSDIASANMRSALLSFTYDSTVLSLQGLNFNPAVTNVQSDSSSSIAVPGGHQQVKIWLRALSGVIPGGDTILRISFVGLVGLDSVCTELDNVSLRPADSIGWIGNTIYSGNSICLVGTAPNDVTAPDVQTEYLNVYPNPASAEVTIEESIPHSTIDIYDMLGRLVGKSEGTSMAWAIPAHVPSGVYQVVVRRSDGEESMKKMLAIER